MSHTTFRRSLRPIRARSSWVPSQAQNRVSRLFSMATRKTASGRSWRQYLVSRRRRPSRTSAAWRSATTSPCGTPWPPVTSAARATPPSATLWRTICPGLSPRPRCARSFAPARPRISTTKNCASQVLSRSAAVVIHCAAVHQPGKRRLVQGTPHPGLQRHCAGRGGLIGHPGKSPKKRQEKTKPANFWLVLCIFGKMD